MNCPNCNLQLKEGMYEDGKTKQRIFLCHVCKDFFNPRYVSLKQSLTLAAKNS